MATTAPPSNFVELLTDSSKHDTDATTALILAPYAGPSLPTPAATREALAARTARGKLTMISLIVDNKMRAFPRFTHYTCVAGEVEDTSVHGKFYAMDRDVRARGGFNLVEIEPSHFN